MRPNRRRGLDASGPRDTGRQDRQLPEELPRSQRDGPAARQLHVDAALLQDEHARPFLARLGQDVSGRRLELGDDRADVSERVIVEIGEDRDRAELLDEGSVHAQEPTRQAICRARRRDLGG